MKRVAIILPLLASVALCANEKEPSKPGDSPDNPRQVTSRDKGPKINPARFAAKKFNGMPPRANFRSFMSACYALCNVWIYAAGDDQELYGTPLVNPYPDFYDPTWGEVFDHVARQMRCTWSWNPENRQFKFERSEAPPRFGVELADGWRREDRGLYVWHAPKDSQFGLDIYDFGHYTAPPGGDNDGAGADFAKKVREHVATHLLRNWPQPPTPAQMKLVKVAGADALYLATDTPRPGGLWRQWSVLVDGNAYLIVSAMPKTSEADLMPAVEKMVASFKVEKPATRPATRPAATQPHK